MRLSGGEQLVCASIAASEGELVELLRTLVRFDTTTHVPGQPAREEAALQRYLAERLSAGGASVNCAEPEPGLIVGHAMVPDDFTFAGRPQLVARFAGVGGGRVLLLNGHIDVVEAGPLERWQHDPFAGVVAGGCLHGRGACDMKGGVACMVFAAETLARLGVRLAGELIVNTVTDEESTGAGGLVSARARCRRTRQSCPSRVGWTSGSRAAEAFLATITVEGRGGHAGIAPRHPDHGGAVNAIEKMTLVLEAVRRLREEWALRPRHPYLSPADCVPTIISGGEWIVSHPAFCRLDCHIHYLPDQADERGWGSLVEREFTDWIHRSTQADPWLRAHPPRIDWRLGGVPPAEVAADDPIVQTPSRRPRRRLLERARRARQLARRRDPHPRGRHTLDLSRPRRHPPRPHHRRVRTHPRPRRLHTSDRRHRHALLRPQPLLTAILCPVATNSPRLPIRAGADQHAAPHARRALSRFALCRSAVLGDTRVVGATERRVRRLARTGLCTWLPHVPR